MRSLKDVRWLAVPFFGYVLASRIEGDALILTSLDYLDNLAVSEVGWKLIVRSFYTVVGNTADSQDVLIRIIQLASICLIASAANKSASGPRLGMLLLTFFTPIAIKMQIRLGLGLAVFLYGYGRLVGKEKGALATMLVAATVHQAILLIIILLAVSRLFIQIFELIHIRIETIKRAWRKLVVLITIGVIICVSAFKARIVQDILLTPLMLILESVAQLADTPSASTALNVLTSKTSFENTNTVIFTVLLLAVVAMWDWRISWHRLKMSVTKRKDGYLQRSVKIAFYAMALFNIGFSNLYYFGRIGTTSYIFYCLFVMVADKNYDGKSLGLAAYMLPTAMCLTRF